MIRSGEDGLPKIVLYHYTETRAGKCCQISGWKLPGGKIEKWKIQQKLWKN